MLPWERLTPTLEINYPLTDAMTPTQNFMNSVLFECALCTTSSKVVYFEFAQRTKNENEAAHDCVNLSGVNIKTLQWRQ